MLSIERTIAHLTTVAKIPEKEAMRMTEEAARDGSSARGNIEVTYDSRTGTFTVHVKVRRT